MEERAKHAWATEERLAHEERLKLDSLKLERTEIKKFGYGHADFQVRQGMYAYLEVLNLRIETQVSQVRKQEAIAEGAKAKYLLARQETKKVTTLKDKQYAAFLKEERRKEQLILDDMRSHLKQ